MGLICTKFNIMYVNMKKKTLHSTKIKMHIFFQSHNNIRNVKYVKKLVCEFNQKENKGKRGFFSEE